MAICGQCNGKGHEEFIEDGRMVQDICYHCSGTGTISEEEARSDALLAKAEEIAAERISKRIKAYNSDPDGEGWAFQAAECGCSEADYTRAAIDAEVGNVMTELRGNPLLTS